MRTGHNSRCLEKGFEPDSQVSAVLVLVQQGQLVDEDRPQCESRGVDQPLGGTWALPPKMLLNCPLKFSIALDLSSWKMRLTSTPASVCGYGPCREATRMRPWRSHSLRTSGAL